MDENLYEMIFKRKSFHLFRDIGNEKISLNEIRMIEDYFNKCNPLDSSIKVAMKIVPSEETSCKRGQEYCLMLYSEVKDNYLSNIGYIGEQLDLFLTSLNIGTLWFGIGKTKETTFNGLEFVIMIAIAKIDDDQKFRKDMFKSKRKFIEEIWSGDSMNAISSIVRFAPSACNTQPWFVECESKKLRIFRYKKPGKRGIMPKEKVAFYNRIDIGIFYCFLELCLMHEQIKFERIVFTDDENGDQEMTLTGEYTLQ